MSDTKYLYVVFSRTNTGIGKIIRTVTKHEYNHVSLSFCPKLCKMFSFARYRKNSPLVGGFVCERPSRYLSCGEDIKVKICRLPILEKEFEMLASRVTRFHKESKKMRYNTFSALAAPFGTDVKIENTYTCLNFVAESLGLEVSSIEELEEILQKYCIYEGSLKKYIPDHASVGLEYFAPIALGELALDTGKHFGMLIKRLLD